MTPVDLLTDLLGGLADRPRICKALGVSARTVRRCEIKGMPVVKIGLLRLYDPIAVRDWILSNTERAAYCEPSRKPGRPAIRR